MAYIPGNRDSFADTDGHILDLSMGLKFLKPRNDGLELLRRIGMNGFTAKALKHEWNEVALGSRSEVVTQLIGDADLVVADAYQYQIGDLIRIEAEIERVTALTDATHLAVTRGYGGGGAAAAHAAVVAIKLGSADAENAAAPAGMSDNQAKLYNYVQTFTRAVDLSNDEIAIANVEGNPLTGNIERRYIEWMRLFAQAFFYGIKYEDSGLKLHVMGGLKSFITTNPTSAGAALSTTLIDAEIKQIVDAGGDPKVLVMGTKQKQKLDAIDANLVRLGLKAGPDASVAGNRAIQQWQSGVLNHPLDVIVDQCILDSELYILDTDLIKIGPLVGNGVNGNLHVEDASTPGTDGKKKVIRGKYTTKIELEKAHSYLYALT